MAMGSTNQGPPNRMSTPSQLNPVPKPREEHVVREAPNTGNVETGTIKGNINKMNQFFEAQKEAQKTRKEE